MPNLLNFAIVHMYKKYQYVCGVWYFLQFQASTGDLGMYSSQVRGDCCMNKKKFGKRHHGQSAPVQKTSNKFMGWELPWLTASFSSDTSLICIKNLIYSLCIDKIGNLGLREEGRGLGLQESTWCLQEFGLLEHPETFILLPLHEMWLIPQMSLVPGDGSKRT